MERFPDTDMMVLRQRMDQKCQDSAPKKAKHTVVADPQSLQPSNRDG